MQRCLCDDGDATIDNDNATIDDDNATIDDGDATIDDGDATIDDGDASDNANAHTACGTRQYTPLGTRRHAGHHATPPTINHTYISVKAICSSNSVLRKFVMNCSDGNSCAVCPVRRACMSCVITVLLSWELSHHLLLHRHRRIDIVA